jgi:cobalt-zinc-cadmium efflux system outer membrane protein
MPIYIRILVVLSVFACASTGSAQERAAGAYTLPEVVELALKSTSRLDAKDARIEAARRDAGQARVWPGPTAGLMAGRTKQTAASGGRYELSLSQPLPVTGKSGLRGQLADLEGEGLRLDRRALEVAVTLEVCLGAFEYEGNRRKAEFAEKRRKRFELVSAYIAGRVFPTPQRRAESRIVSNRVKSAVAEALRGESGWRASLEKLRIYVPLDSRTPPEIVVPWLTGARAMDATAWTQKALAQNPDLQSHRSALRGARLRESLVARERVPEPSLIASYEKGQADITGTDYALGLSFAFPSWNGNRSAIKGAESWRLAEERELAFAEQSLRAELGRALVEYETARRTALKYPREELSELEKHLEDADEGFRKGQLDLLTFLELDASVAETFAATYDAQLELAAKAAQLLSITADPAALTALSEL